MGNASPRWAVWKKMVLRRSDGVAYMTRWRLVQTPFFAVYVHRFDAPDPGVDLHDHPWPFATLVVRGGYVEEVADVRCASIPECWEEKVWRDRSVHTVGLQHAHRITSLLRLPTWTVVVRGRSRREWGFYEPTGWVASTPYSNARRDLAAEMA